MQGLGASAAGAVGLASTRGPVGNAQAIPPAIVAGVTAATAGAVAYDWLLRDHIVDDSNAPPEGLTADALEQGIIETVVARASNNRSTFIDNRNLIDGTQHIAYTEGKIAAIDALNEQASQSEVGDAAQDAVNDYYSDLMANLIESWNETVNEALLMQDRIDAHPDADEDMWGDILASVRFHENGRSPEGLNLDGEVTHTLPNGDDIDVLQIEVEYTYWLDGSISTDRTFNGPHDSVSPGEEYFLPIHLDHVADTPRRRWLNHQEFGEVYDEFDDARNNVNDGLIMWVDNVYGDVQAGDLDVTDLITPREQAAMMAEDESMAQAIADLAALNIPVDVEREATIYLPHVDATVRGTLGITQDQPIESGETYDPDEDIDGSVYLTYDVSLGEGTWGAYETGVDGGEVTFTDEPWPGTTFRLHTTAGESVELVADDFTPVDEDGDEVDDWEDPDRWLVDISADVETAITEIDEVEYFASSEASQLETIQLQNEFTVERIEDSGGNEVESMDFESSEPQSDDNYITQEEWDEMAQRNQDLIEAFEDSQSSGGLGDFFGGSDIGGVPTVLIVVVAAAAAAFGLTN
ncbi:hypothetical protein GRS48_05505 [Halorubrum sp. JWXQ-INN 858]|uniref:hypothetical protein n=1 Tax=Halorubrum sp. JWXQ-INN 858 TaxID=2690782 RepID=UPI00135BD122|nr:hypothetical protein [Halorubrum sp. JWXQ-INN 858]MWV64281.1 hypothetical protein [Halorubrum sp. JWXQ-INN 858]